MQHSYIKYKTKQFGGDDITFQINNKVIGFIEETNMLLSTIIDKFTCCLSDMKTVTSTNKKHVLFLTKVIGMYLSEINDVKNSNEFNIFTNNKFTIQSGLLLHQLRELKNIDEFITLFEQYYLPLITKLYEFIINIPINMARIILSNNDITKYIIPSYRTHLKYNNNETYVNFNNTKCGTEFGINDCYLQNSTTPVFRLGTLLEDLQKNVKNIKLDNIVKHLQNLGMEFNNEQTKFEEYGKYAIKATEPEVLLQRAKDKDNQECIKKVKFNDINKIIKNKCEKGRYMTNTGETLKGEQCEIFYNNTPAEYNQIVKVQTTPCMDNIRKKRDDKFGPIEITGKFVNI